MLSYFRYAIVEADGVTQGYLHCDIRNGRATGLYEKYGFRAKDAEGELQMVREERLT